MCRPIGAAKTGDGDHVSLTDSQRWGPSPVGGDSSEYAMALYPGKLISSMGVSVDPGSLVDPLNPHYQN